MENPELRHAMTTRTEKRAPTYISLTHTHDITSVDNRKVRFSVSEKNRTSYDALISTMM